MRAGAGAGMPWLDSWPLHLLDRILHFAKLLGLLGTIRNVCKMLHRADVILSTVLKNSMEILPREKIRKKITS